MKLNWLGRAAMNNAARAALQRNFVADSLFELGGTPRPGPALEVGCGGGVGLELIRERFGATHAVGLDLDPKMIPAADRSFDAVFDFGAIHLVPEWEAALDEVRRVLRPGGAYYFEWVTGRALRALYPAVTEGFRGMAVPDPFALIAALARRGIAVGDRFVRPGLLAWTNLVGDVIGVGRVPAS